MEKRQTSKAPAMPATDKAARQDQDSAAVGMQLAGVKKEFRRRGSAESVRAVDGVTLAAGPNEMLVLLGPSGCGKTTLLRCIAGLETPDAGEIRIGGRVVYSSDEGIDVRVNRRKVSLIFQSYTLWPHMTVNRNVAYPLQSTGVKDREVIRERVSTVLGLVGLGDLGKEYPGTLSGGQQQRVSLARALVTDPAAILFDEPLSNIDAKVRIQLRREIRSMHDRIGFAGIYVTHDQEEALSLGTKVAVLREGRVEQLGTPQEIYSNPRTRYVAEFIGRANTLPGTVREATAGQLTVESLLGRATVPTPDSELTLRPGDELHVVARPEDFRLIRDDRELESARANPNVILVEGAVTTADFHGPRYLVSVAVGSEELNVEVDKWQGLPPIGSRVALELDRSAVRAVVE